MRRLIALSIASAILATGTSLQAAETGHITGRVINASTGEPQPGVVVILTTGTESGTEEATQRVRTDDRGRYEFRGLSTGDDRFYALDARFEGGTFAGRAISIPSDTNETPVIETMLRVWPTTTDPAAIVIRRDDLFVVSNETGAVVIESVTVANVAEQAYIGRGQKLSASDASGASVAFALPDEARNVAIVDSEIDIPAFVEIDSGVAATVAFPPGQTRVTLSYELPGSAATVDLSRPALYPTLELSIYAEAPLEIRSNRLTPRDPITLEGTRYARWSTDEDLNAGDPLQAIAVADAGLSAVPLLATIAALMVLGVLGAMLLRRRRAKGTPPARDREELLVAVAELDLAYEKGTMTEDRYKSERARLRSELQRTGAPR